MDFQFLSDRKFLSHSIIRGVVWSFMYYYIRRGWNPENEGNLEKFKADAFYGGLAVALTGIFTNIFTMIVVWLTGFNL